MAFSLQKGSICTMKPLVIFLLMFVLSNAEEDDRDRAKVLILGAGATGIAAGKYLHDHGMTDFLIIEGSNRIGGRLKEVQFGGKTLEVGANWIQPGDASVNPLVDIANNLGIQGKPSNWSSRIIRSKTGDDLTQEGDERYNGLNNAIEYAYTLADDLVENGKPDMSIRSALRLGGWIPTTALDKVLEYFDYDFEYADIPKMTSLKSTAVVDNGEAVFVTDQRGFGFFLRDMANGFLEEDDPRLLLEKVVKTIKYNDTGVTVSCADGSSYVADYVIVTFSIGVLQRGVVQFVPELPDWKTEEIFQFDMALYSKIFLKFPDGVRRFWDDAEYMLYAHTRRGHFPIWQNLEAEGLFDNGTNLLLVTVTGQESKRVEYHLSDREIQIEVMTCLRNIYGQDIPDPEAIMLNRWSQDPLFFGAYSNWPVEVSEECHRRLQANVDRVYFGGEATHPLWNGYIQGGLLSGEREAEKILKCIGGECLSYTTGQGPKRGCTYDGADNYDKTALVDDGSCSFTSSAATFRIGLGNYEIITFTAILVFLHLQF
ncbi:uncharacterized protein LOC144448613 [Glandiceps talaboti]